MKTKILLSLFALTLICCGTNKQINYLKKNNIKAELLLAEEKITIKNEDTVAIVRKEEDNGEPIIMNAIKDENGEMIATDVISPAKVTARFRNIAERKGKIIMEFDIMLDKSMLSDDWQIMVIPQMQIGQDTCSLLPVIITGKNFMKYQLRGYQHYNRFMASLAADSLKFIDKEQLEIFLQRNIPMIYKFKYDSAIVTFEEFKSAFGVSEKEAVEHYTNHHIIKRNAKKREMRIKMYQKYVKNPFFDFPVKTDTIPEDCNKDFIYRYVHVFPAKKTYKKAVISLSGNIKSKDARLYDFTTEEPLTFYISSLNGLADYSTRYVEKIIYRKVTEQTACYIDFNEGADDIDLSLGNNQEEINRINNNIREIIKNKTFILDSVRICASCSPEGEMNFNKKLSERRAKSIAAYFNYMTQKIKREETGTIYNLETGEHTDDFKNIKYLSENIPENWKMLDKIVEEDNVLQVEDKLMYKSLSSIKNPDIRENALKKCNFYKYLRTKIYPKLRTVKFDFYLHRRDMKADSLITNEIDSVYMKGIKLLEERLFEDAIKIFQPYKDLNYAISLMSLDYNKRAIFTLEHLKQTDKVKYLLAILYFREKKEEKAVKLFEEACYLNPSLRNRGNLDPEISTLIQKYKLNSSRN